MLSRLPAAPDNRPITRGSRALLVVVQLAFQDDDAEPRRRLVADAHLVLDRCRALILAAVACINGRSQH